MKKRKTAIITVIISAAVGIAITAFFVFERTLVPIGFWGRSALVSAHDADGDGTDDYRDIVEGARLYVSAKPEYKSAYYAGGYPPDGEGVCTDVVWFALREAGYDLKAAVDADIAAHPELYPDADPDPNIDFRRVVNLNVFFSRHAESLTTDLSDRDAWQPGDIVISANPNHIMIVSDRCSLTGTPAVIHHGGSGSRYEDNVLQYVDIVAHYRLK